MALLLIYLPCTKSQQFRGSMRGQTTESDRQSARKSVMSRIITAPDFQSNAAAGKPLEPNPDWFFSLDSNLINEMWRSLRTPETRAEREIERIRGRLSRLGAEWKREKLISTFFILSSVKISVKGVDYRPVPTPKTEALRERAKEWESTAVSRENLTFYIEIHGKYAVFAEAKQSGPRTVEQREREGVVRWCRFFSPARHGGIAYRTRRRESIRSIEYYIWLRGWCGFPPCMTINKLVLDIMNELKYPPNFYQWNFFFLSLYFSPPPPRRRLTFSFAHSLALPPDFLIPFFTNYNRSVSAGFKSFFPLIAPRDWLAGIM